MSAIEALGDIGPAANEAIPAIEKAIKRAATSIRAG